jgi:hypothetical protein
VNDASLTDKAAAALDDAAGSAEKAVGDVKAGTTKAAESVKAETTKVADTAKTRTTKAVDSAASEAGKVAAKVEDKSGAQTKADPPPARSMDEIEAELDATRERLAGRIDDLTDYVKPANILERKKAKLKSVFVDEYGGIKPDRVLMAAGVLVAVVGLSVLRRRRRRS